jgi:outer membrane protein OmpA-like peptidoglycan-associated protein
MKTILIGSIVFVIWSSLSTYFYVCQIKGLCPDETEQIQLSVSVMPEVEPVTKSPEPESVVTPDVKLESPESFIVQHAYNHDDFIKAGEFENYIDQIITYLGEKPTSKVLVVGNTDNIASESSNNELGLRRAAYTKKYLIANGIPENSISITSKGESSPIAKNSTKSGRAKNRRTEIEIN